MEIKRGMIVKVVRIIEQDGDDIEDLLKYVNKIGIISRIHYSNCSDEEDYRQEITINFDYKESGMDFYEDEIKIIGDEEQSNMFRGSCFWCRSKNKKNIIGNSNFNIIMYYCPKCLR